MQTGCCCCMQSPFPPHELQVCLSPRCDQPTRLSCTLCLYTHHLHEVIDSVRLSRVLEELAPYEEIARQRLKLDRDIEEAAEEEVSRFREVVRRRKALLCGSLDAIFPETVAKGLVDIREGVFRDQGLLRRVLEGRVVEEGRVPELVQKLRNMSTVTSLINVHEPLKRPSCTCQDDLYSFEEPSLRKLIRENSDLVHPALNVPKEGENGVLKIALNPENNDCGFQFKAPLADGNNIILDP